MTNFRSSRPLAALLAVSALLGGAGSALLGACGPFTDVTDAAFCPFVLEIFTLGITSGTTPTTYDPTSSVSRLQMAAFLSRTVDGALKRGSRRAALDEFWTPQSAAVLGITTVGAIPRGVTSDGADLWVANAGGGSVSRVRGSDGKLLETWTGASSAYGVVVAAGMVVVTALESPGKLYRIDPSQTAGAVTTVASTLPASGAVTFDGGRFWTVNPTSVSIVTPGAAIPWTVTTVTTGFTGPAGPIFDGSNIWVSDFTAAKLFKLDSAGVILQTVTLGGGGNPEIPAFDGTNIWVPTTQPSVVVVRASSGAILATLTGNGMNAASAYQAAFDGQRVAVTSSLLGDNVALWKAADLSPLGSISPGSGPVGICSDGIHFWIALSGPGQLARF